MITMVIIYSSKNHEIALKKVIRTVVDPWAMPVVMNIYQNYRATLNLSTQEAQAGASL